MTEGKKRRAERAGKKKVEASEFGIELGSLKLSPGFLEPPPHPMSAEADRFEDEDDAFDDGVH